MFPKNNKELILRQIKSHLGFKKDLQFAEFLGISASALNMWYKRKSFDYDIISTKCAEIDGNWLLTGDGEMLKAKNNIISEPSIKYGKTKKGLPLISIDAMAGLGKGDATALELDADYYNIPEFSKKADFLIRISGNSMYPKYANGDIVACKRIPTDTFIQWGKVYIMDTVQGALCKRVEQIDGGNELLLISDNSETYKPFKMHKKEIRSLAVVVGLIRLE
jgi:phage repressor protein C with HTH and peptisase S24 domain